MHALIGKVATANYASVVEQQIKGITSHVNGATGRQRSKLAPLYYSFF
jgi:hypothetical protein